MAAGGDRAAAGAGAPRQPRRPGRSTELARQLATELMPPGGDGGLHGPDLRRRRSQPRRPRRGQGRRARLVASGASSRSGFLAPALVALGARDRPSRRRLLVRCSSSRWNSSRISGPMALTMSSASSSSAAVSSLMPGGSFGSPWRCQATPRPSRRRPGGVRRPGTFPGSATAPRARGRGRTSEQSRPRRRSGSRSSCSRSASAPFHGKADPYPIGSGTSPFSPGSRRSTGR